MVDRWAKLRDWLQANRDRPLPAPGEGPLALALPAFTAALCADLNVAGAIGVLNEAAGKYNTAAAAPEGDGEKTYASELEALEKMNSVLGVLDLLREGKAAIDKDEAARINALIEERNAARASRDFKRADAIRDELLAMGIEIKDSPQGTTWTRVLK